MRKLQFILFLVTCVMVSQPVFGNIAEEWNEVNSEYVRIQQERREWESKFKAFRKKLLVLEGQWHLVSEQWWAFQIDGYQVALEKNRDGLEKRRREIIRPLERAFGQKRIELEKRRLGIESIERSNTAEYEREMHLLSLEFEEFLISEHDNSLVVEYEIYAQGMKAYLGAMDRAIRVATLADEDAVKLALVDLSIALKNEPTPIFRQVPGQNKMF